MKLRTIPYKETLTVEFKSDVSKLSDSEIFEAVVAFANTEGGDLYIGVEDDGEITGVHPTHSNPVSLSAYIANNTVPPISVRTEIIEEEDKQVVAVYVPKSFNGVSATASGKILRRRLKADSTPENVPMYPTEISSRLSDIRLLDYSSMPLTEASVDDFDSIETDRLLKAIRSYSGDKSLLEITLPELYKALGFVKEYDNHLVPTVTGMLMLGKTDAIKQFVPTYSTSFQVLEGTKVKVNEDFVMPVLASIERLNGFIEAWNPDHEIEMGLFRIAVPDFNTRAIREAIVNAFSHRDYSKMGRVRVAVTDEGLTVANPGGFIEGITIENLLTAEPHGRNPLLADALKRIGLAEKTGRGIDRIFEGSLIYGKLLPDYSLSTTSTVSLFIPRSAPDIQIAKMISDEQNRLGRSLPINT
ncbi:MAG: putative DNA binding domain-containing protein, partial [Clostridia bacterium]|nr:putative DNA binding domain-containing protein [Clostridia bacterium]